MAGIVEARYHVRDAALYSSHRVSGEGNGRSSCFESEKLDRNSTGGRRKGILVIVEHLLADRMRAK